MAKIFGQIWVLIFLQETFLKWSGKMIGWMKEIEFLKINLGRGVSWIQITVLFNLFFRVLEISQPIFLTLIWWVIFSDSLLLQEKISSSCFQLSFCKGNWLECQSFASKNNFEEKWTLKWERGSKDYIEINSISSSS